MSEILYISKINASNNTLIKARYEEFAIAVDVYNAVNIERPVFIINDFRDDLNELTNFNYCYFPRFKRFYYCTITIDKHRAVLTCEVDVLMSHSTQIKQLRCNITRNQYIASSNIADNRVTLEQGKQVQKVKIQGSPFNNYNFNNSTRFIALTTLG